MAIFSVKTIKCSSIDKMYNILFINVLFIAFFSILKLFRSYLREHRVLSRGVYP